MGPLGVVALVAGVLLLVVLADLLWTTPWVDGGSGPLSAGLATGIVKLLGQEGGGLSRSIAGPIVLFGTLVWVAGVWAGWTLVFVSGDPALVPGSQGIDVGLPGTLYFVAYSTFASGNGDLLPASSVWQIVTAVAIATGILLVTLGIPYVLSVVGAVPTSGPSPAASRVWA
jgi:hypothetical protein